MEIENQPGRVMTFRAFGWGYVIRDNPRFVEHASASREVVGGGCGEG